MIDNILGIQAIGTYIPSNYEDNLLYKDKFEYDDSFLRDKLGVLRRSIKGASEDTSDLAVKAIFDLKEKTQVDLATVDCLILITQNPDSNIPHTSAVVHDRLGLSMSCACFDVSLGCSGYVYGLSILKSFMQSNGFRNGILVTADPYSKIIDKEDKNTFLIFGDAATATLISDEPVLKIGEFVFGTNGSERDALTLFERDKLYMNGRGVFNFAARTVPENIKKTLEKNSCRKEDVDLFLLHQGSRYIVETITKKTDLDCSKVPYEILHYGNTVSSSIPLMLSQDKYLGAEKIVLSGFGVGLSWGGTLLYREEVK